jgi:hypothetical protein
LRRERRRRIGILLFLIPTIIVLAIVAYAIISAETFQDGTLYVGAQSSNRYYATQQLNVRVDVAGQVVTTPGNVSLAQGSYAVSFPTQPWYVTPPAKTVTVRAGQYSYAVGVYTPIVEVVSLAGGSFNSTSIGALHGVTPVVWVNPSSSYQVITSDLTGRVIIPPMQNYTYVFQQPGTFVFSFVPGPAPTLVVKVS